MAVREGKEAYPLERHCIESYVVDPDVIEQVLGLMDAEQRLATVADGRFWLDVGRATLEDLAYQRRQDRPSLEGTLPASREELIHLVEESLRRFRAKTSDSAVDPREIIGSFEDDMRSTGPLWTRVDGKEVLRALEAELRGTCLPGGDLEGRLFKWCAENGPPHALVADVKAALSAFDLL